MTVETTTRCYRAEPLSLEQAADGKTRIHGLAVPYNAPSEDLGGFREVFKAGAFRESVATDAARFANVEHDRNRKLGKTSAGTLEFQDGKDGLRATITLPDTGLGRDTAEEVRQGLLDAMSIEFRAQEEEFKGKGDSIVREIRKAELRGVALTSYPAFPQTAGTVALRSLEEYRAAAETEEEPPKPPEQTPTDVLRCKIDLAEAE